MNALDEFLSEGEKLQLDSLKQTPNMNNLILLTTTETSSLLAQVCFYSFTPLRFFHSTIWRRITLQIHSHSVFFECVSISTAFEFILTGSYTYTYCANFGCTVLQKYLCHKIWQAPNFAQNLTWLLNFFVSKVPMVHSFKFNSRASNSIPKMMWKYF